MKTAAMIFLILLGATVVSHASQVLHDKIAKTGSFSDRHEFDEERNPQLLFDLERAISAGTLPQFCQTQAANVKGGKLDTYSDAILHYVCDGVSGIHKNDLDLEVRGKFTQTAKDAFKAARQTGGLQPADASVPGFKVKPPADAANQVPGWYNKFCGKIAQRGRFADAGGFETTKDLACAACKPFFVHYNQKKACKALCDEGCPA